MLKDRADTGSELPSGVGSRAYGVVVSKTIPTIVRWSLILFVFTIPFEAAQTTFASGSLSLAKLAGVFFTLIYLFHYNPLHRTRRLPAIPAAMWWFLGYVAVYLLNGFFVSVEYLGSFLLRLLTLLQLIMFSWITSALLQDGKTSRRVIVAYTIATAVLAACTLLQVPGFYGTVGSDGRATAMDENPNATGELMATGAVALTGLLLGRSWGRNKTISLILLGIPLLVLLVKTGARASIIGFTVASSVYLLMFWRSKKKLWAVCVASAAIVILIYIAAADPLASNRLQKSYYEGNVAGRQIIFSAAGEMFLERPLIGWHPVLHWHELGRRVGTSERDAHNIFLHILLEVGLIGAIPFLIGLGLCLRAAWKASAGNLGLLPLAMMVATLVINMAHTGLAIKPFWLVLAVALGSAAESATKEKRLVLVRAGAFH